MPETQKLPNDPDAGGLQAYIRDLRSIDKFRAVSASLAAGRTIHVGGMYGSSPALFMAALRPDVQGAFLVLVAGVRDGRKMVEDLHYFFGPEAVAYFPPWESGSNDDSSVFSARLEVLCRLQSPEPPGMIVAPIVAAVQEVVPPEAVAKNTFTVRVGTELDLKTLTSWLESRDMRRVPMAESGGEWSLRGSILDVFPHSSRRPFRIELFGDSVESVREFEPSTQSSVRKLSECRITLIQQRRFRKPGTEDRAASLLDHLPDNSACVFVEKDKLEARIAEVFQRSGDAKVAVGYEKFVPASDRFARAFLTSLPRDPAQEGVDFVIRSVHRTAPGMDGAIGGFRELIKKKLDS